MSSSKKQKKPVKRWSGHSIDLIASGYEWVCPTCERLNHEIEAVDEVTCKYCLMEFPVEFMDHAW